MAASASAQRTPHLIALDGLRGFAALLVIVSHSANHSFLPKIFGDGLGKMGVILFFGLSGFLMGYLYCRKHLNVKTLWDYAVNRLARILPLYYFTVLLTIVSFCMFDFVLLKADSILKMVNNVALIRGSSILWTISVEVHFYFVFVILWFFAVRSQSIKAAAALLAFQIAVYLSLTFLGVGLSSSIFSWLHVFLAGSLLGIHYPVLRRKFDALAQSTFFRVTVWATLLLAVLAIPGVRRMLGVPIAPQYLDPITVGYPLIVLTLTVFAAGPFILFRHHILRWFGKISYSLYLLHLIVLTFVEIAIMEGLLPTQLGFPVTLALSSLVAWAAYTFLELPAQNALRSIFKPLVAHRALTQGTRGRK